MGAKRYKDQIMAQILKICEYGCVSKTKVVYASGLNFKTIKPYLITLGNYGLIETIPGTPNLYRITERGEKVLVHLNALNELMPQFIYKKIKFLKIFIC